MLILSTHHRFVTVVSRGQSFNLLKQGSLRRRGKLEIAEAKRNEAIQKAEIEQKLAAFDRMQAQIDSLQQQAAQTSQIQGMLQGLENSGLIKQTGVCQYEGVDSYEEQQQLLAQRQSVSQATLQEVRQEQMMQEEGEYLPSPDRARAGM